MTELSLGFSPCPNDTFIFYALVHGLIDTGELSFAPPLLEDVEMLNSWAMAKKLDVTKLSFHAIGHMLDEYCILSSGSALGRGCGPLLIAGREMSVDTLQKKKIAIPGKLTTAALLLKMFLPENSQLVEMRFDRIMGAIKEGIVDGGVIIHESRFTYEEQGFVCLQDLGQWWEDTTNMPIPLGCIAARRSLGTRKLAQIDAAVRASVDYAFAHPDHCLPYIGTHSQETAPKVVQNHIDLYVNDFSKDLGIEGKRAIEILLEKGRATGALPQSDFEITAK